MFTDEYIPAPPVQSTVVQKKEPGIKTTVTEVNSIRITVEKPMETCSVTGEPGTEISIKEYSDVPNVMRLTRIPEAAGFHITNKKKKPRMKVKKFDWGGRR